MSSRATVGRCRPDDVVLRPANAARLAVLGWHNPERRGPFRHVLDRDKVDLLGPRAIDAEKVNVPAVGPVAEIAAPTCCREKHDAFRQRSACLALDTKQPVANIQCYVVGMPAAERKQGAIPCVHESSEHNRLALVTNRASVPHKSILRSRSDIACNNIRT